MFSDDKGRIATKLSKKQTLGFTVVLAYERQILGSDWKKRNKRPSTSDYPNFSSE